MTATAAAASKGRSNGLLSLFTLGAMPSKAVRGGLQVASLLVPLLLWSAISSLGLVAVSYTHLTLPTKRIV